MVAPHLWIPLSVGFSFPPTNFIHFRKHIGYKSIQFMLNRFGTLLVLVTFLVTMKHKKVQNTYSNVYCKALLKNPGKDENSIPVHDCGNSYRYHF